MIRPLHLRSPMALASEILILREQFPVMGALYRTTWRHPSPPRARADRCGGGR
jgi:hypothetical protein